MKTPDCTGRPDIPERAPSSPLEDRGKKASFTGQAAVPNSHRPSVSEALGGICGSIAVGIAFIVTTCTPHTPGPSDGTILPADAPNAHPRSLQPKIRGELKPADYLLYVNKKSGYRILYPTLFVPEKLPDKAGRQAFGSPAGDAKFVVYETDSCGDNGSLAGKLPSDQGTPQEDANLRITYRYKGKRTRVVSGEVGSKIFYEKLVGDKNRCIGLSFVYEKATSMQYEPVVRKVAGSLGVTRPPSSAK